MFKKIYIYNFNKTKFIISKILFKIVITIFNYIKNLKVVVILTFNF